MAEKYDTQKLMEICLDFIHVNIIVLDYAGVLWELLLVLFLELEAFMTRLRHILTKIGFCVT